MDKSDIEKREEIVRLTAQAWEFYARTIRGEPLLACAEQSRLDATEKASALIHELVDRDPEAERGVDRSSPEWIAWYSESWSRLRLRWMIDLLLGPIRQRAKSYALGQGAEFDDALSGTGGDPFAANVAAVVKAREREIGISLSHEGILTILDRRNFGI